MMVLMAFQVEEGGTFFRRAYLPVRPSSWSLKPYPNPLLSGKSLILDLEMTAAGAATWKIFDVTGREVARAFDGFLDAGRQRLQWTPLTRLAGGVYFMRLQVPGSTRTSTFLIVR